MLEQSILRTCELKAAEELQVEMQVSVLSSPSLHTQSLSTLSPPVQPSTYLQAAEELDVEMQEARLLDGGGTDAEERRSLRKQAAAWFSAALPWATKAAETAPKQGETVHRSLSSHADDLLEVLGEFERVFQRLWKVCMCICMYVYACMHVCIYIYKNELSMLVYVSVMHVQDIALVFERLRKVLANMNVMFMRRYIYIRMMVGVCACTFVS